MSIYLSYLLSWSIISGELLKIGGTRVILHLPLLWFFPFSFLATAIYRLYNVRYVIDGDGIVAINGILSFKIRTVHVRFEDIRSVKTHQNLMGRLLDIGALEIRTAATSQLEIFMEGVGAPHDIHSMIESEKAQRQHLSARPQKNNRSRRPTKTTNVAIIFALGAYLAAYNNIALSEENSNNSQLSLRASVLLNDLGQTEEEEALRSKLGDEAERLKTAEQKVLQQDNNQDKVDNTKQPEVTITPSATVVATAVTKDPTLLKTSDTTKNANSNKDSKKSDSKKTEINAKTPVPDKLKITPTPVKLQATPTPLPVEPTPVKVQPKANLGVQASNNSANAIRKLNEENARLQNQVSALLQEQKNNLAEIDRLQVQIMVAETQVEKLNRIIDEQSGNPDNSNRYYRGSAPEADPQDSAAQQLLYATVIANTVTPRTGPGSSYSPISSLNRGDQVPVEGKQAGWYQVLLPSGAKAWIHSAFLKIGESNVPVRLPGVQQQRPPARIPDRNPNTVFKKKTKIDNTTKKGPQSAQEEARLADVDREAFLLLEELRTNRDSESGS